MIQNRQKRWASFINAANTDQLLKDFGPLVARATWLTLTLTTLVVQGDNFWHKKTKVQNERGFWWNEYDEHMYCVTCEHNLWNSIVIVYCDLCLPIVLILSPGLNCFQRLLKFRIFIARVLSPMRSYQALISWQIIGTITRYKNFHFLSSPPQKGLTGPSLLLLHLNPPVEFATSRVPKMSSPDYPLT